MTLTPDVEFPREMNCIVTKEDRKREAVAYGFGVAFA